MDPGYSQDSQVRRKNGATGTSDIEGKAARVAANERETSEFQLRFKKIRLERTSPAAKILERPVRFEPKSCKK